MVYVTHDQVEAMTMADKIVVMNEGEIIQVGTPLELFDNPKNLFVASFLGSPEINLMEGTAEIDKSKYFLRINESVAIPLPANIKFIKGQKLIIGIRPQSLKISKTPTDFTAKVSILEATGTSTFIFSTLDNSVLCAETNRDLSIKVGDLIFLQANPKDILVFDPKTSERIKI